MYNHFHTLYEKLYDYYGPQNWWPAETTFEMMVSAILVQNTNWKNVEKAIGNLKPYLEPPIIARLPVDELAEIIRPSGFYQVKAKRMKNFIVWLQSYNYNIKTIKRQDIFRLRDELLSINGIGKETADVILLYGLDKPIFVVDAYTRRILRRLGYQMPQSYDAFRKMVEKEIPNDLVLLNEYHALLVKHAKEHCKKDPICADCPLQNRCDYFMHTVKGD